MPTHLEQQHEEGQLWTLDGGSRPHSLGLESAEDGQDSSLQA